MADRQKSPLEELINSWPVHRVTIFSEEMIQSLFFECFQIMMFLRYFFVTTSSVFCFLFFKVQSKIGVRIIHGRALYKGKYGTVENGRRKQQFLTFLSLRSWIARHTHAHCSRHNIPFKRAQRYHPVTVHSFGNRAGNEKWVTGIE